MPEGNWFCPRCVESREIRERQGTGADDSDDTGGGSGNGHGGIGQASSGYRRRGGGHASSASASGLARQGSASFAKGAGEETTRRGEKRERGPGYGTGGEVAKKRASESTRVARATSAVAANDKVRMTPCILLKSDKSPTPT